MVELKVKNRSTLHYVFCQHPGMKIVVVNSSTHKTVTLECYRSRNIRKIKEMLSHRWGIPVDVQRLSFMEHPMEDHRTLSDYDVQNDCLVHLRVYINISIIDVASAGDMATWEAEPTATMSDIKTKIDDKLKAYMSLEDIGVNFVKAKIQDPRDYFRDSTLNLMLNLFREEMRIFVDETEFEHGDTKNVKLFTFKVAPSNTVDEVYDMIKKKLGTGINPWTDSNRGKSIYAGQWPCIGRLHGDGGICLSSIFEKSPFDLSLMKRRGMLIFAEPKKPKKMSLTVQPCSSVRVIKNLIQEKRFLSTSGEAVLRFGNIELQDSRSLLSYKIGTNSELILGRLPSLEKGPNEITIFVKTLEGTTTFRVRASDTVENLKSKILHRQGITVNQQRLIYAARQLEDSRVLAEYGIKDQATLHLMVRQRGC